MSNQSYYYSSSADVEAVAAAVGGVLAVYRKYLQKQEKQDGNV